MFTTCLTLFEPVEMHTYQRQLDKDTVIDLNVPYQPAVDANSGWPASVSKEKYCLSLWDG